MPDFPPHCRRMHCATLSVGKNFMQKITTSYTINRQAAQELRSTQKQQQQQRQQQQNIQKYTVTEEIANFISIGNYLLAN